MFKLFVQCFNYAAKFQQVEMFHHIVVTYMCKFI